ncbi:hypothetical protein LTR37_001421 [Vermiconidia calcicola]|uniref:Uncharacterized protein n=1 Tax=Vermiconidia calcicola TaxID=1690605 RepID=A0ACC3NW24_9PEZI|nr:hypothetical protein LTR37_001421 [Vermiconidia calcicola]
MADEEDRASIYLYDGDREDVLQPVTVSRTDSEAGWDTIVDQSYEAAGAESATTNTPDDSTWADSDLPAEPGRVSEDATPAQSSSPALVQVFFGGKSVSKVRAKQPTQDAKTPDLLQTEERNEDSQSSAPNSPNNSTTTTSATEPEAIDDDTVVDEVEYINSSRKKYNQVWYWVKWEGSDELTEEPASHLLGSADEAIADFHHLNPKSYGPPKGFQTPQGWTAPSATAAETTTATRRLFTSYTQFPRFRYRPRLTQSFK